MPVVVCVSAGLVRAASSGWTSGTGVFTAWLASSALGPRVSLVTSSGPGAGGLDWLMRAQEPQDDELSAGARELVWRWCCT
eukprot:10643108-Alexandrium_andersonii.AAC.1